MKNIVLFDLDGTLADCSHRLPHILGDSKDWQPFFESCDKDTPIAHIIQLARMYFGAGYEIWIVSARSAIVSEKTIQWINKYLPFPNTLLLRKPKDRRDDDVLKEEWLTSGTIPKERIHCVYEDRRRVVDMWRRNGIPCLQVAQGDF